MGSEFYTTKEVKNITIVDRDAARLYIDFLKKQEEIRELKKKEKRDRIKAKIGDFAYKALVVVGGLITGCLISTILILAYIGYTTLV